MSTATGPRLKHSLVQLPDGRGVIGSNASAVVDSLWKVSPESEGRMTADTVNMVARFKEVLKRVPDASTEGVNEVTMATLASHADEDQDWMRRVTDMVFNTTNVFADLKAMILEKPPTEQQNAEAVKTIYDSLLDDLHVYETGLLYETGKVYEDVLSRSHITVDLLKQDFKIEEDSQRHKTINNVLRQYIGALWSERYCEAKGEILQDRETRLALHFREFTEVDKAVLASMTGVKDDAFRQHDVFQRMRLGFHHKLEQLSKDTGISTGILLNKPASRLPLGDYAPTTKAWSSAIRQLESGERTNMLDIIKGWGPEAAAYVAWKSGDASKKKKKKKRAKKAKSSRHSGEPQGSRCSQCGTEGVTLDSESSEETWADALETQTGDKEDGTGIKGSPETGKAAATSIPGKSPSSPTRRKKKGHRLSRYEQIMHSADWSTPITATRTPTSDYVASEDWDTIRRQVQQEFRTWDSQISEEAKKHREYLSRLIPKTGPDAHLRTQVTESRKRGRRAGNRAPYVPHSRRAPLVISRDSSVMQPPERSSTFDVSTISWPAIGGSEEVTAPTKIEDTVDASDQADSDGKEENEMLKLLSSLNLDYFSTVGVDPDVVERVTQYIPCMEEEFGVSGVTVSQVVSILGGWDKVIEAHRQAEASVASQL